MSETPVNDDAREPLRPHDDGAADHLEGLRIPTLRLRSTTGQEVDLAAEAQGTLVVYAYPRTAVPGEPLPPGWMQIPGAFGCTAENCSFRDHSAQLQRMGVRLLGLSAQPLTEQRDFAFAHAIGYPLVNDSELALAQALALPTFEVAGMRLYRRLSLVAHRARIVKVFYPVFAPDAHPAEVEDWLARFFEHFCEKPSA